MVARKKTRMMIIRCGMYNCFITFFNHEKSIIMHHKKSLRETSITDLIIFLFTSQTSVSVFRYVSAAKGDAADPTAQEKMFIIITREYSLALVDQLNLIVFTPQELLIGFDHSDLFQTSFKMLDPDLLFEVSRKTLAFQFNLINFSLESIAFRAQANKFLNLLITDFRLEIA